MNEQNFNHEFFATSSVQDFKFRNVGDAPDGYPKKAVPDSYSPYSTLESYKERKQNFINHVLCNPSVDTIKGLF